MRKSRKLLILILLMAIGFATVTTTLFINGSTTISINQNDFKVLFTKTVLDDVKDNSLIVDDTHIVFTTNELKNIGDKSVLEYTIKNNSRNYDALLNMTFSPETTEYIRVTNVLEKNTLESDETTTGTLTVELIKGYVGENALEQSISVEINASAVEKNTLGEITSEISVSAKDGLGNSVSVSSVTINGEERENLLNELENSMLIDDKENINTVINLSSDNLGDVGEVVFNVSQIAVDGDKVVVLHLDELNNKWEFVGEDTVDSGIITLNLKVYEPVAFVVKNADGTYETLKFREYEVESGSLGEVGSVVSIGSEKFNVIGTGDNNTVILLAQNKISKYLKFGTSYWNDEHNQLKPEYGTSYPVYVYNSNSNLYDYIEDYLNNLKVIEPKVLSARLISYEEFESLTNNNYNDMKNYEWLCMVPEWWTGTSNHFQTVMRINRDLSYSNLDVGSGSYIRPVIILKR